MSQSIQFLVIIQLFHLKIWTLDRYNLIKVKQEFFKLKIKVCLNLISLYSTMPINNSENNFFKIYKSKDKLSLKLRTHFLLPAELQIKKERKNKLNKLRKMQKKEGKVEKESLKTHWRLDNGP